MWVGESDWDTRFVSLKKEGGGKIVNVQLSRDVDESRVTASASVTGEWESFWWIGPVRMDLFAVNGKRHDSKDTPKAQEEQARTLTLALQFDDTVTTINETRDFFSLEDREAQNTV